jgi:leukotriene-A4 hydrolase
MQDTPAVKITYDANVTILNSLRAKMSANSTGFVEVNETHTKFMFRNDIKIPSYLIALAVGNIKYHSLGRRVGVISEPEQLVSAKKELDQLENYLDEVENWIGIPYAWGTYNILVLPPAFPFGGMENPLLSFISPTMITGDKS